MTSQELIIAVPTFPDVKNKGWRLPSSNVCSFNQDELTLYSQEDYQKILSSKNIAELLYYTSLCYNLPLNIQQLHHLNLKFSCDSGGHYIIYDCPYCCKRHFFRTPCGSFFCKECRDYLTSRVKRNAKKYLWNCSHFYAVFTLPQEIQDLVTSWERIRYFKQIKSKGMIREKPVYCADLVYKSVNGALQEYYKKHKLETGFILLPHSYGSENLNWFFHLNALISSKAFNQDGKIIDYRINFNELRSLYKKYLSKNFKVSLKDTPQIRFSKKKGSVYIPYNKSINIILDYFRHIPLSIKNIKSIEHGAISYQTFKQTLKKKQPNHSSLIDFFYLVMQHIPPHNFRTARAYGLYANHTNKKREYPKGICKPLKSLKCEECETEIDKEDFIGRVYNNLLIWVNPFKINNISIFFCKSILDYKDFEMKNYPEIDTKGRVLNPDEPPPDLKPLNPLKFPPKDADVPSLEL